ncbi:putative chaperone activity of bc1 complex-like, mitochondrial-like [Sesbania bispinosa]|nr:putative chaperone activity of bc1 complex-like, mitochondrial-like [Sesbania bispinosa]
MTKNRMGIVTHQIWGVIPTMLFMFDEEVYDDEISKNEKSSWTCQHTQGFRSGLMNVYPIIIPNYNLPSPTTCHQNDKSFTRPSHPITSVFTEY